MQTNRSIKTIAIIPARGGSKSIPHKNITSLMGRPLISYSIASGLAAKTIDRLIVSTDDPQIAEIALSHGAEVPFLRPVELAKDDTPDFPVIEHAIRWLETEEDYAVDIVVQLRPTSPLRPKGLIDEAVTIFKEKPDIDCVRAVVESHENPFKMWLIEQKGLMNPLIEGWFDEPYNIPRQELPKTYWQTGHIDVIGIKTIKNKRSLTGITILPVFVDRKYCVDIDNMDDLCEAEKILSSGILDIHNIPDSKFLAGDKIVFEDALPKKTQLIILDFDGVLTDNKVIVSENGHEAVTCNRSDGLAIDMLRNANLKVIVLTQEVNPVVEKRCTKMGIKCYSGETNKLQKLTKITEKLNIPLDNCIYVGNEVNDLECMRMVGCPVAVADAVNEVKSISKIVLHTNGGQGAVRELYDLLMNCNKHKRKTESEGNKEWPILLKDSSWVTSSSDQDVQHISLLK